MSHRDLIQTTRRRIPEYSVDLDNFDKAHMNYIRAKTAWTTLDSDETMVDLIGTWSRMTRLIWQMEDKYAQL